MKTNKLLPEEHISAAIFLVMTLLAGINIISRVLADFSFAFTEELIVYLFVVASMFGAASGVTRHLHMGLSIVTDAMPPRIRKVFIVIGAVACIALFGLLGWQGAQMILSQVKYGLKTPVLQFPEWWFTLSLPLGSAFYIIRTVQDTIRSIKEVG